MANTFFYSGYEFDEETGLYYLRTRYYNPKTARFITEDTFNGRYTDPLSLNKYTYCHNNPISYYDPNGTSIWSDAGEAFGNIGKAIGNAAKAIGTAAKAVGDFLSEKIIDPIKAAFSPKPTANPVSTASNSTSGRSISSTPSNYITGSGGSYSGSSAGAISSISKNQNQVEKVQSELLTVAKGFENKGQEQYTEEDIMKLIDPDGDGRFDERWKNGAYPKDSMEWSNYKGDNWYFNSDGRDAEMLLRAKNTGNVAGTYVGISYCTPLGAVTLGGGNLYDANGNIAEYTTFSFQAGIGIPGIGFSNGLVETNFANIKDFEGSSKLNSAYSVGFIVGYGNSSSTSLENSFHITNNSSLEVALGGIAGAWGYGYSSSKIKTENGKIKYKMKEYDVYAK